MANQLCHLASCWERWAPNKIWFSNTRNPFTTGNCLIFPLPDSFDSSSGYIALTCWYILTVYVVNSLLYLQDIAVVPLLVILPVLESQVLRDYWSFLVKYRRKLSLSISFCDFPQNLVEESIWPILLAESLKALGGLGLLSIGGKFFLRRVFEVRIVFFFWNCYIPVSLMLVTNHS